MTAITLLSDFGLKDEYVAVMKGVILTVCPDASIVDISHQISPQNVAQAGRMLRAAYSWFPTGTVHLAVVDPGVGSSRAAIAARYNDHLFVAPDNGLLVNVWGDAGPDTVVQLTNNRYFLSPVSRTFHGRDLFAPVAAHLAKGIRLDEMGTPLTSAEISRPKDASPRCTATMIAGTIMEVDHFGNLRSDIEATMLDALTGRGAKYEVVVNIGKHRICGVNDTYADRPTGELMALVGSRGQLEISVNCGNAEQVTGVRPGTPISVVRASEVNQNGPKEED